MSNLKALEILAREVRPLTEAECLALVESALTDRAFI